MIWLFLKRLGDNVPRWTIIAALAVCEPLAFLERAGRPDSVSLFLLCATALVFVETTWRWRDAILFLLGALSVPAALQYAADVLVLIALLQIWFKPFTRRELTLWGAGAISGAGGLAWIYASHHVLKIFIESTLVSKHSSAGRILQNLVLGHGEAPFVLSDIAGAPFRDYAAQVAIATGVIVFWIAKRQHNPLAQRLSSLGVACGILIPVAIQLLGKYPIYYAYMGTVPAIIFILAALARLGSVGTPFANATILALLLVGGAGRYWWKAWNQGEQHVSDPSFISTKDTVVADYPTYYQLIGRVRELFAVGYAGGKVMPHIPVGQASRINRLIVRDSMFAEVAKKAGGRWDRVANLTVVRRGIATQSVMIDDDTQKTDVERIGIYVRIVPK
jgi:hypothetical protein